MYTIDIYTVMLARQDWQTTSAATKYQLLYHQRPQANDVQYNPKKDSKYNLCASKMKWLKRLSSMAWNFPATIGMN